jgi:hypothetical protein
MKETLIIISLSAQMLGLLVAMIVTTLQRRG